MLTNLGILAIPGAPMGASTVDPRGAQDQALIEMCPSRGMVSGK